MDLFCKDLRDGMIIVQACQCSTQFIELCGLTFTRHCRVEPCLRTRDQLTDDHCHDEKYHQDDDICGMVYCEYVIRLYEKIIESKECDQCTDNARSEPPEGSDHPEWNQIQQSDKGGIQRLTQRKK